MPVQHLPNEEALPPDSDDLATVAEAFVTAVREGRVTQATTVHQWADALARGVQASPPPEPRPSVRRWT